MTVAFRVDSSLKIGSGHLVRCLTLADGMKAQGVRTLFVCRELTGNLISLIRSRGHEIEVLPPPPESGKAADEPGPYHSFWLEVPARQDALESAAILSNRRIGWLIVDHYALDSRWQEKVRPAVARIMVIDDLADRLHDCDLLLDATHGRNQEEYLNLAPRCRSFLVGSRHALLRPEFARYREEAMRKRFSLGRLKGILVCFGGMDPANLSSVALKGLESVESGGPFEVDIVLGQMSPHYETICRAAAESPLKVKVYSYVDDIARLMVKADLSIGAAGTITWERCCLGLPSLACISAKNQETNIKTLSALGALKNLGRAASITERAIAEEVSELAADPERRRAMSERAFTVCDGRGLERVIHEMMGFPPRDRIILRSATGVDCEILFQWQSCPSTRAFSRNPRMPTRDEHEKWFKTKMSDRNCLLFIIENGQMPVGYLRLDRMGSEGGIFEISIGIAPGHRGRGVAKSALIALRKMRPQDVFMAEVHEKNTASIRLFKSLSFEETKKKGWYTSRPKRGA